MISNKQFVIHTSRLWHSACVKGHRKYWNNHSLEQCRWYLLPMPDLQPFINDYAIRTTIHLMYRPHLSYIYIMSHYFRYPQLTASGYLNLASVIAGPNTCGLTIVATMQHETLGSHFHVKWLAPNVYIYIYIYILTHICIYNLLIVMHTIIGLLCFAVLD